MKEIGILESCGASEWESSIFIIPQMNESVWQIVNLKSVNKAVV